MYTGVSTPHECSTAAGSSSAGGGVQAPSSDKGVGNGTGGGSGAGGPKHASKGQKKPRKPSSIPPEQQQSNSNSSNPYVSRREWKGLENRALKLYFLHCLLHILHNCLNRGVVDAWFTDIGKARHPLILFLEHVSRKARQHK